MRVVTVAAHHFSFAHRMVRVLNESARCCGVAGEADFRLGGPARSPDLSPHGGVAVGAGLAVDLVRRCLPS